MFLSVAKLQNKSQIAKNLVKLTLIICCGVAIALHSMIIRYQPGFCDRFPADFRISLCGMGKRYILSSHRRF